MFLTSAGPQRLDVDDDDDDGDGVKPGCLDCVFCKTETLYSELPRVPAAQRCHVAVETGRRLDATRACFNANADGADR